MHRLFAIATFLSLAACGTSTEAFPPPGATTIDGFSVPFSYITIAGEQALLFEYASREETDKDLYAIAEDGRSIGGKPLPWNGPVHVFATANQIAIYVGENLQVLKLLESEGGEQFAGDPYEGMLRTPRIAPPTIDVEVKPVQEP